MKDDLNDQLTWRWPSYGLVAPLDISVSLLVIGALAPLFWANADEAVFRAKFSEALLAGGAGRFDVVERLAHTGEPVDHAGEPGAVVAPSSAEVHLQGRMGGGPATPKAGPIGPAIRFDGGALDLKAAQAAQQARVLEREQSGSQAQATRYVSEVRYEGSVVVVAGRIDQGTAPREYELALVPAVLDVPIPQVMVWQCGRNRLPDGWVGPSVQLTHRLAESMLPSHCRSPKTAP